MKLFGSTKKLIDKTKNGDNIPSLEVVEVVLVQYNLVDSLVAREKARNTKQINTCIIKMDATKYLNH